MALRRSASRVLDMVAQREKREDDENSVVVFLDPRRRTNSTVVRPPPERDHHDIESNPRLGMAIILIFSCAFWVTAIMLLSLLL